MTDEVAAGSPLASGPHDEVVAVLVAHAKGRAPADLAAFANRLFRDGGAKHAVLLPGVRAAIAQLQAQGYILGLATNDTVDGLNGSMQRVDLLAPFVFQAGCDSGHGAKPGPGMVHAFCSATGLLPTQVAVIGDSIHDLEMAARAGSYRVAVLCGTSKRVDLAPHADLVLDDISGLLA